MTYTQKITVKRLSLIGKDDRGETYGFSLSRHQKDYIYLTRKKGSISGNSYHTGKSPATDPKTFILLNGKIELRFRDIKVTDSDTIEIEAPAIIEIKPHTIHAVYAMTDIIMLECNSIEDIQDDNHKAPV